MRQQQAKAALRQYIDEVSFVVNKECRDALRRTQRLLRDEFTARARSLQRSSADALAQAERAMRLDPEAKERRRRQLEAELRQLEAVGQRTAAAVGAGRVTAMTRRPDAGDAALVAEVACRCLAATAPSAVRAPDPTPAAPRCSTMPCGGWRSRCGWRSPGRSRPESRRCSTPWSARSWRPPTPASAPGSSPGTGTPTPTGSTFTAGTAASTRRPFRRREGALEIDLGGLPLEAIDHLDVWWPASRLSEITLIDTPGHRLDLDRSVRAHLRVPRPPTTSGRPRPTPCSTSCATCTAPTSGSSRPSTTTTWPAAHR